MLEFWKKEVFYLCFPDFDAWVRPAHRNQGTLQPVADSVALCLIFRDAKMLLAPVFS
jgi:hypothetical protein